MTEKVSILDMNGKTVHGPFVVADEENIIYRCELDIFLHNRDFPDDLWSIKSEGGQDAKGA